MSSEEKAVIIRCVDERYSQPGVRELLPTAYDVTAAGAAKHFVTSTMFRVHCFEQIKTLRSVGKNITEIIVVDHFDAVGAQGCAAYGDDDSRESHEANLRHAAKQIVAEPGFKDIKVKLLLHDIDRGEMHEVTVREPAELVGVG